MTEKAPSKWAAMREEYERKHAKYYIMLFKEPITETSDPILHDIILTPANSKWHEKAIVELKASFSAWDESNQMAIVAVDGKLLYSAGKKFIDEEEYIYNIISLWYSTSKHMWMDHDRQQDAMNRQAEIDRRNKNKST